MLAGHVIVGAMLSGTVTVKLHDDDSLQLLKAVHVTVVVVALWNADPDGSEHDWLAIPLASLAVKLYVAVVLYTPFAIAAVIGDGHVTAGGVVHVKLTTNVHVLVSRAALTAVQTTDVAPRLSAVPDAGEHDSDVVFA